MHYLYLITRDDGETYVGVTQYPFRRMTQHFTGRGSKELAGRVFIHDIIAEGSEDDIFKAEQEYIKVYKPSLNKAAGGWGGNTGGRKGEENHFAKITNEIVLDIRNFAYNNPKMTQNNIAEMFNVSRETVSNICLGKTWTHIGGPISNRVSSKYSEEEFLEAYKLNPSPSHLATKLNISRSTVYNLIKRLVIEGENNDIIDR